MEDFGFKLQDIKKKYGLKKIVKGFLILLSIIFAILIFIKIVKIVFRDNNNQNIENIPLIKATKENIKRVPEEQGGLVVDNLDVSVYNVLDNNKQTNSNPIVKKTKQDLNLKENIDDSILLEQDLLTQKINEINDSEENLNTEIKSTEPTQIQSKNEIIVDKNKLNTNIKINNNEKKSTTNVNDLKKLGNESLVKNLKEKKDVKPGLKVQLLALKSKDSLITYWEEIKNKYSTLFSDKNYYIEKVDINHSGVIYRLQVGNFNDRDSALEFCNEYIRLTNKNKTDCIVAKN